TAGLTVSSGGVVSGSGLLLGLNHDAGLITGLGLSGSIEVQSGGEADAIRVSSGTITVDKGGVLSGAALLSGNGAFLADVVQGLAIGAVLGAGQTERVASGGVASGAVVGSGGVE